MRKILALAALIALVFSCASAEKRTAYPKDLLITQRYTRVDLSANAYMDRTYPRTSNAAVNDELAALIDAMAEKGKPLVPLDGGVMVQKSYIDVGASVSRTGESWASFLIVARVAHEREQLAVDYDTRVYDIAAGEQIALTDLFSDDSPAWALLSDAVRAQLTAYFPDEAPDAAALDALCDIRALREAKFTLGAAWITLTYRADALYPGKTTLMHVRADYTVFRPLMTELAFKQTDMSGYKMVALTYDDGPSRGITLQVMRALRNGCASATFFMLGTRMEQNHDVISAAHDALYAQASHNYEHIWGKDMQGKVLQYKEAFARELEAIVGRQPRLMRAPGGNEEVFIAENVGLPLIHWNLISNDASGLKNPREKSRVLAQSVSDGTIVLFHDMTASTAECTRYMIESIAQRGYICVTVEEMFAANGIALEPNVVYTRIKNGVAQ